MAHLLRSMIEWNHCGFDIWSREDGFFAEPWGNSHARRHHFHWNVSPKSPRLFLRIQQDNRTHEKGRPAGVGMGRKPPAWLQDGDVVEVGLEQIGTW